MNVSDVDDLFDDLFHGCALTAFLQQSIHQRDWPCPEATRRRAYRLYEDALAAKNGSSKRATCALTNEIACATVES